MEQGYVTVKVQSIQIAPHSFSVSESEYWKNYQARLEENHQQMSFSQRFLDPENGVIPFIWMSYRLWCKKIIESRKLLLKKELEK